MLHRSQLVATSLGPLPSSLRGLVSHVFLYLHLSSLDLGPTPIQCDSILTDSSQKDPTSKFGHIHSIRA